MKILRAAFAVFLALIPCGLVIHSQIQEDRASLSAKQAIETECKENLKKKELEFYNEVSGLGGRLMEFAILNTENRKIKESAEKRLKAVEGVIRYTVQPGDTLSYLASTFLDDAKRWTFIRNANKLNGTTIYVGQNLLINTEWKDMEYLADEVTGKNKAVIEDKLSEPVNTVPVAEIMEKIPAQNTSDATVSNFSGDFEKDTPSEFIKTSKNKFNFSPSLHVVTASGLALTSDGKAFGTFMGAEGFTMQTDNGNLKFGGLGLNWNVEIPDDNNRVALTVTPLSARVYKRLYGSVGYTRMLAGKNNSATNAFHVQFSHCVFGCK